MSELTIAKESFNRVDLMTVSGRIDSSNYAQLETAVSQARDKIVLNLAGASYMSSAGVRVLVSRLKQCQRNNGDLRLSEPSSQVIEVLELTGLTSLFQTFAGNTAAVGSF
jgi:anti-anti-sigma factor